MRIWRDFGVVVGMVAAVGFSAGTDTFGQTSSAASTSAALIQAASSSAASASPTSKSGASSKDQSNLSLIEATRKLKGDSENLIRLQQAELAKATEKLEELRTLVADGLVAKNELQYSEDNLSIIQKRLDATRQQVADADRTITDIAAFEQSAKSQAATAKLLAKSRSFLTPTILRYNGQTNWAIANLTEIQGFFSSKFGHSLPTSAIGQSGTHNQLGYDHRNAVDVALHPDSVEGMALINYLQTQGIPFLAFRAAVPGVATGAHIHIGTPSHRLA